MKTVLITGVSRGIGKAAAEKFLKEGWLVTGTSTTGKSPIKNQNLAVHKLDLLDGESIRQLARKIGKIDVIVNNAGIFIDRGKSNINSEALRKTLEVNLIGLADLTDRLLPRVNEGGSIVNVSSSLGSITEFGGHYAPAYQISKGALNMYTRALASTLKKRGIRVAAIDPGWVKTDMGGKGADREPKEPAEEIYELATKKIDSGYFWHRGKKRSW